MSITAAISGTGITFTGTMPAYSKGHITTSGYDFSGKSLAVYGGSKETGHDLFSDESPVVGTDGNVKFAWSLRTTNVAAWLARSPLSPGVWVGIYDTDAEEYLAWGFCRFSWAEAPDDFTADALEGVGASQTWVNAQIAAAASGDVTFASGKGPVIYDATNDAHYRISIDAGRLSLVEVT